MENLRCPIESGQTTLYRRVDLSKDPHGISFWIEITIVHPSLAAHFGAALLTITRELRGDPVRSFANKLALMVNDTKKICRRELKRLINKLRTFKALTSKEKSKKFLGSIRSQACAVEEIAHNCGLG
jgi:hypothetical protein